MFSLQLTEQQVREKISPASGEGSFDDLCRIRQALSTSTDQAMLAIAAFREAWGLA
ncbi:MAG: hypothetical protein JWM19_4072 [Actinomycetia bacterium]|nr:hypothetical protein [Actinomycetes bacterium]